MMRKYTIFLLLLLSTFNLAQVKKNLSIPAHPKIGLSLAGGGAKGFAHVGALKIIDSLGIKIDYISGTSMGAIVGGLYASGYSAKEIEKIVITTDFYSLLNNEKTREDRDLFDKTNDKYIVRVPIKDGKINFLPKSISSGQKNIFMLKDLLKDVSHQKDFSKLPIPFMCMATNLETGQLKIFEKGDLVKSIMASAAYPSLLDPVIINDSIYIDGAITVNYPSKQLKDKGIDIVIGIDLNQGLKSKKDLNSAIDILNQVIDFRIQEDTNKQYQYTDINIKPELKNYSATSYDTKDSILIAGYQAAEKYIPILKKLPKTSTENQKVKYQYSFSNVYKIDSVRINGNSIFNDNYVKGKMNLKIPSLHTYSSLNKMMDKLYATDNYQLINYDLETNEQGNNILQLQLTENQNKFYLKFGLHYDEIYRTGLLLNVTLKRPLLNNSKISLDAIVGNNPRYYFNYYIDNGYIPSFGINSTGTTFIEKNSKNEEQDKWIWIRNEAYIQSTWKDSYAIGVGLNHDYFEIDKKNVFTNFINAYGFLKTDTRNNKNFPTTGVFLDYKIRLVDLFNEDIEDKVIVSKTKFSFNIPINKSLTFRGNLFGGITIGNNLPPYYQFKSGGIFEQEIINFNPFPGLYFGSLNSKHLFTASSEFQYKFNKKFYLTLHYDILNNFEKISISNALKIKHNALGLQGGYDSPFGQVKLDYSHNFNTNNNIFSVILGHWF